ncbi:MAG: hypothetical protein JRN56_01870 [Nitrososphaerota archaeon]|jgi:hypothetical protein|nr:hypothetical protein [Nitrososphaerota archaeon]MDG6960786.1 hypothetical protein [Nitrososphaerota archaeon]MDG6962328.1 hypothetical protein [Nitrososphaerota archaeon]MDG6971488.1 hypothetical protein [Nitrososphaerota archaeon]MDG6980020.1 hypothetical protein [Nitrososphaerota archaeon]
MFGIFERAVTISAGAGMGMHDVADRGTPAEFHDAIAAGAVIDRLLLPVGPLLIEIV